jgi:hypothetical protein
MKLALAIEVVETKTVAVTGVRVCGPHHFGYALVAASDSDKEKPPLVCAKHAVDSRAQLFGTDFTVIEEDEAFSRPRPFEYRHGLVDSNHGCRNPSSLGSDVWIGKR